MSENLFYYLEKNGIANKKQQEKIAQATAEWLKSREKWQTFREENTIRLLLSETPFHNVKRRQNNGESET